MQYTSVKICWGCINLLLKELGSIVKVWSKGESDDYIGLN